MIFETHCHLNDETLLSQIDDVLLRSRNAGVKHIVVPGWDGPSSLRAIEIAHKYPNVYAAIGFYPTEVYELTEEYFDLIMQHINDDKVVAVGEIGLDFYWCKDSKLKDIQKEWFIKQIEFANKHKKPIIIHSRDSSEEILKVLKEHNPLYSGTLHCYSGSVEMLKDVFNLNLYIGLDGPVTYKNAKTPKEVATKVPLDRLLIETDSPYLSPHPLRGTINKPENLNFIIDEIATLKNVSREVIIEHTYKNACSLFGIKDEKNN